MKRIILLSLFIFSFIFSPAQNLNSNWYFGEYAGINFNTTPPTALTNGNIFTTEGCASISDDNGNILFYTNGIIVYNKQHNLMQNGYGLKGHTSTTQSAVIVPLPNSSTIYYVFTLDAQTGGNGVCYSIVDMSLDGGLGEVTSKNQRIIPEATEKVTIIKHSNDQDFWVVFHGWDNNDFYAYLLSSSGLNQTPVTTSIGSVHAGDDINTIGYMKSNLYGNKIAVAASYMHFFELFRFDNSTGILSDVIKIPDNAPYGIEFSPNSIFLYVSDATNNTINQYDISYYNKKDIVNSKTLICGLSNLLGALQIGPNSKIYCPLVDRSYLTCINSPDEKGLSCDFARNAISLNNKTAVFGLPPLVDPEIIIDEKISSIFFPNVFTPNNDGYNDNFYPVFSNIVNYKIAIYNKWGTKVFETEDINQAWDGKTEEKECSAGVYYWVATYSSYTKNELCKRSSKGSISLILSE